MRVSAANKQKTARRIRSVARRLFTQKGFEQTTTRDLAKAANIAVGTLFNYFPTKESLGLAMIGNALSAAADDYAERRRGNESLEEDLFAFMVSGLRRLEPDRAFAAGVLEAAFHPLASRGRSAEADVLQDRHMHVVGEILTKHQIATPSSMILHLYWSLYLGVLGCWSRDTSNQQCDTLALVDHATRLFAAAAASWSPPQEESTCP